MPPRLEQLTKRWSTFDLPILPFLAPRVFQPWPRSTRRNFTADAFPRRKPRTREDAWANHDTLLRQSHGVRSYTQYKLHHWKPSGTLEGNSETIHGTPIRDEDDVEFERDGRKRASTNQRTPRGEDELWSKYEEIWGPRGENKPIKQVGAVFRPSLRKQPAMVAEEVGGKEGVHSAHRTILRRKPQLSAERVDLEKKPAMLDEDRGAKEEVLFPASRTILRRKREFRLRADCPEQLQREQPSTTHGNVGLHKRKFASHRNGKLEIPPTRKPPAYLGQSKKGGKKLTKHDNVVGYHKRKFASHRNGILEISPTRKPPAYLGQSKESKNKPTTYSNIGLHKRKFASRRNGILEVPPTQKPSAYLGQSGEGGKRRLQNLLHAHAQRLWQGIKRMKRRKKLQAEVNGPPNVPYEYIRLAPQGPFGNFTFNSDWNTRFALLARRYDLAMKGVSLKPAFKHQRPRIPHTFVETFFGNKIRAEMAEDWKTLTPQRRGYIWSDVMLLALELHPRRALDILMATLIEPYPPGYAVADCVDYIASYVVNNPEHFSKPQKDAVYKAMGLLITKSPKNYIQLHQRTIRHAMALNNDKLLLRWLYLKLVEADHPLTEHTLVHFGTRLAHGHFDDACEILQRLQDQGCDFNSPWILSFCSILLRRRTRLLSLSIGNTGSYMAPEIFEFMLGAGAKPNIITYNILLENSLEENDDRTAWELHDLAENSLKPDAYTYSLLMNDSKIRMDPPAIKKVLDHVRKKDILSSYIVNDILHAILLLHQQERRSSEQSDKPREQQQQSAFHRMLHVYSEYFNIEPLARLVPNFAESYPELIHEGTEALPAPLQDPSGPTLVIMLTGYLDNVQNSLVVKQFYDQFRYLVLNNDPVVAPLMQTTIIWNLVLKSFGSFPERLGDCYTLIADMLSPKGQTAQSQEDGIAEPQVPSENETSLSNHNPPHQPTPTVLTPPKPDIRTWSILLQIFMAQKQPRAAEKVLDMMRARGIEPSIITWNKLAHGYAAMQDVPGVVGVVTRLQEVGLRSDNYTMSAMTRIRNRRQLIREMEKKDGNRAVDVRAEFVEELREELVLTRSDEDEDSQSGFHEVEELTEDAKYVHTSEAETNEMPDQDEDLKFVDKEQTEKEENHTQEHGNN